MTDQNEGQEGTERDREKGVRYIRPTYYVKDTYYVKNFTNSCLTRYFMLILALGIRPFVLSQYL